MRLTIEIAEDWLDILDTLADQVTAQDASTPEAALEHRIFAQLKNQRFTALTEPSPTRPFWISAMIALLAFWGRKVALSMGLPELVCFILTVVAVAAGVIACLNIAAAFLILLDDALKKAARM